MEFNRSFEPRHGSAVPLSQKITRITAPNSGPFTFHGTNTYLIGTQTLAIVDPGPADAAHLEAIKTAVGNRPVSHIVLTHTHMDHTPAAYPLAKHYQAKLAGEGPHRTARDLYLGEINPLDASSDKDFNPDIVLKDQERLEGDGWTLEAVATPGHTANHLAFSLLEENVLLSGDHVMAWSTSIVAPPDGSMADFMGSLETLLDRDDAFFCPGHGGRVRTPQKFMRGLKMHRLMREAGILERLKAGDRTISEMVRVMYRDVDTKLHGAAALSVLAHLEDLVARNLVETDGTPSIDGVYLLVS